MASEILVRTKAFITAVREPHVNAAMTKTFREPQPQYNTGIYDTLHENIDTNALGKKIPRWLDLDAYIAETTAITSSSFLQTLKNETAPPLQMWLGQTPSEVISYGIDRNLHIVMSNANSTFYGISVLATNLAAVVGETFPTIMTNDGKTRTSYRAIQELSSQFPQPVVNSDELIERLQILYPENTEGASSSAFRTLLRTDAFRGGKTCPAVSMTKLIFEAYGSVLADLVYQERLKSRIVKLV